MDVTQRHRWTLPSALAGHLAMNSKTRRISRRTVLRGLGAAIALPYLEVMGGETHGGKTHGGKALGGKTLAATRKKSDPSRLACFYIPGGISRYGWFPEDTGPHYTLAASHAPLAPHRDQFSVLTNLLHIRGRISGHEHPHNWLTGHNTKITPGTVTNTISMDQVAARHLGPTYLPSLALSWKDGVGTTTLSRNALGVDIPAIGTHRTVFERLFPPADRAQIQEAQERLALDRSVLDTAVGSVKDLRRRLGPTDQSRLEQYLDSIRDVELRLSERERILERGRPAFDEASVRVETERKNSMQEHIDLMMDLIALAFQTDMTRVVTHCLGGEGGPNYDEYRDWAGAAGGQVRGAHDFHHKGSGARGVDNPDVQVLAARDTMLCASLARLMDKLASIETSEGTLLDHTVLLMGGSQISSHSGKSFPTLLAGGKQLGFRHGQHLEWDSESKPMSDLYLTILQQLGCPVTAFKESTGPIGEILA